MKRFAIVLAAALCLALGCALGARAQDAPPLPGSVIALLDAAHPELTVAVYDGWGDEACGRFAVAMTDGQRFALCMAEKPQGGAAYALTIDNENALRDGQEPDLYLDTGEGDSLWISYQWGDESEQINFWRSPQDGVWRFQGAFHYEPPVAGSARVCYTASVSGGALRYARETTDENDNLLTQVPYVGIPVSEAYAQGLALSSFDISRFQASPAGGIPVADGLCDGLLEEGDALLDVDLKESVVVMLVQKPDGARRLRLYDGDNLRETGDLPEGAALDAVHAGDGEILVSCEGQSREMGFSLQTDGRWALSWLWANANMRFGPDWAACDAPSPYRNDGYVYGVHPWGDLLALDFSGLPHSFDEALSQMDAGGYALVNNPDPADRLHLRAAPSREAVSLGKFYNRTPVQVLGVDGEWAHVRIGQEGACLEGYMMTAYLAFGADKDAVACAFPQEYAMEGARVVLYDGTGENARPVDGGTDGFDGFIVGIAGDAWYVLLRGDGAAGYARRSLFWAGNG